MVILEQNWIAKNCQTRGMLQGSKYTEKWTKEPQL